MANPLSLDDSTPHFRRRLESATSDDRDAIVSFSRTPNCMTSDGFHGPLAGISLEAEATTATRTHSAVKRRMQEVETSVFDWEPASRHW